MDEVNSLISSIYEIDHYVCTVDNLNNIHRTNISEMTNKIVDQFLNTINQDTISEEMFLIILDKFPHALKSIKNQSLKLCMKSINSCSHSLQYVNNQSYELCMYTVSNDGLALQYVIEQTPTICYIALCNNKNAYTFVDQALVKKLKNNLTFDEDDMSQKFLTKYENIKHIKHTERGEKVHKNRCVCQ